MSRPKLAHNVLALTAVQAAGYLFPLVTVPYLARVLGVEAFGTMVLVQSMMMLAAIVIDYGFSLSAVRAISAVADDPSAASRVCSATLGAQGLLYLGCLIAAALAVTLIPGIGEQHLPYLVGLAMTASFLLNCQWLYQAHERLKAYSLIQISGRLLSLPLLFVLVRDAGDIAGAIVFGQLGTIFANLFALYWARRKAMVTWTLPAITDLRQTFIEGWPIFSSKIATAVFQNSGVLVVGAVAGGGAAGLYGLAEKIRRTAQSLMQPINSALYPRFCHLFHSEPAAGRALLRRVAPLILSATACGSLLLFVLAPELVHLFGGSRFDAAAGILRLMAPLPFLAAISGIAGLFVMLPNALNRPYNRIILAGTLSYLAVLWPLVRDNGTTGAAIALLFTEGLIAVLGAMIALQFLRRDEATE